MQVIQAEGRTVYVLCLAYSKCIFVYGGCLSASLSAHGPTWCILQGYQGHDVYVHELMSILIVLYRLCYVSVLCLQQLTFFDRVFCK